MDNFGVLWQPLPPRREDNMAEFSDAPPEAAEALKGLLDADPEVLARLGAAFLPAMRQAFNKEHWPANIEEWAQRYVDLGKEMLAEKGEVEAITIFLSMDGDDLVETHVLSSRYMKNEATKEVLAGGLTAVASQTKAFASLFISEVWMVQEAMPKDMKEGEEPDISKSRAKQHPSVVANKGSLEFHPERKEFLMVSLETRDGVKMYQHEITRDNDGKPTASDVNWADEMVKGDGKDIKYKGRFMDLLSDVPKELMQ